MSNANLKISFCTTCKGRAEHLKQTLPQNLKNNADYPNVEFVILDYDSQDGLGEWIKENFQQEMASGKIRYAKFQPAPYFKMAHAKNMAHRLATGDVVCNLDADNTTAPGFAAWLNEKFSESNGIVYPWQTALWAKHRHEEQSGTTGRIALMREDFMRLHGYDERYTGWGNEDGDLVGRARLSGLKQIGLDFGMLGDAISHSHDMRLQNLSPDAQHISKACMDGTTTDAELPPREKDSFQANKGGQFGCGKVHVNFQEELELAPAPVDIPKPPPQPRRKLRTISTNGFQGLVGAFYGDQATPSK